MASGAKRCFRGSRIGTGSAMDILDVGFKPTVVKIVNQTGLVTGEWHDAMPEASVAKRVTAGTMTMPTTNGITPLAGGFRLGADTDLNVAAETFYYECWD
jgi:hypothetical protein